MQKKEVPTNGGGPVLHECSYCFGSMLGAPDLGNSQICLPGENKVVDIAPQARGLGAYSTSMLGVYKQAPNPKPYATSPEPGRTRSQQVLTCTESFPSDKVGDALGLLRRLLTAASIRLSTFAMADLESSGPSRSKTIEDTS